MRKPKGFFNIKDGAHRAALLIARGIRNIPVLVIGDGDGASPRECPPPNVATPAPLTREVDTPTLQTAASTSPASEAVSASPTKPSGCPAAISLFSPPPKSLRFGHSFAAFVFGVDAAIRCVMQSRFAVDVYRDTTLDLHGSMGMAASDLPIPEGQHSIDNHAQMR